MNDGKHLTFGDDTPMADGSTAMAEPLAGDVASLDRGRSFQRTRGPGNSASVVSRWANIPVYAWRIFQNTILLARYFVRYSAIGLGIWLFCMVILIAIYGFVTPPGSALMASHWLKGDKIDQRWVDIDRISPNLVRAVVTSEDGRYCKHWGVDPKEIMAAIRRTRSGTPRGASTITMQLAKNLFLWPSKSYLRKALEVPLVFAMEAMWSKRRILEVYLNVVEWGPGIYGAQAAARHHFKTSAAKLSAYQSSLLAVSLPNPLERKARAPSRHVKRVARVVRSRVKRNRSIARCVLKKR